MAEDLRSEPSFAEQPDGHVTVRLPIESPISPEERAWTRELEDRAVMLSEDRRVRIEAARGTELTNAVVRSLLNIDSAAARQSLQRLRDAGLLEQDGERRGARYRIVPGLRRPVWIGLDRVELCSTILDMTVHGSVTNSMVRQELGLSRNEAVALLGGLVAEGLLELRGSKRGSHYVLNRPGFLGGSRCEASEIATLQESLAVPPSRGEFPANVGAPGCVLSWRAAWLPPSERMRRCRCTSKDRPRRCKR